MSDKQKGRADAAKGSYNPPSDPLCGIFSSRRDIERTAKRREDYREGYYDKRRQMGKK